MPGPDQCVICGSGISPPQCESLPDAQPSCARRHPGHKLPAAASGDVCGASGSRTKGRGTPQAPTPSHAWTAWRVIAAAICAPFDIGSDARRDGNAACRACATRSPCASRARCRGNQGPRLVYSSATRVCSSTTHVAISNTGPAASPPTSPSGAACRRSAACR